MIYTRSTIRMLLVGSILVVVTGCAAEGGIMVPSSVDSYIETLQDRGEYGTELLAIGRVTVFRPFTEEEANDYYEDYVDFSTKLNPGLAPKYSEEEFASTFAGWTRLKVYESPLGMAIRFQRVLVPADLHENIQYVPVLGGQFGISGDLLAARMNSDGFYIVSSILCPRGEGYRDCAEKYSWGLFDARSGSQLDLSTLQPENEPKKIDPNTYELVLGD